MHSLPPAPAAQVMTLEQAARLSAGKGAAETITLGDVEDMLAIFQAVRAAETAESAYRVPFRFGPRTKGRRDASLRSRSNRRK